VAQHEETTLTMDQLDGVRKILVVTAHPDDVDFGVAGSVAVWVKAGVEVTYCVVTDGDAGGSDRGISRAEMASIRREEQRAAASEVGVTEVLFLGYPDGRLTASLELRRDLTKVVRQVRATPTTSLQGKLPCVSRIPTPAIPSRIPSS
jgi:LmbE family N-acetylglucosaminyl deacetylase